MLSVVYTVVNANSYNYNRIIFFIVYEQSSNANKSIVHDESKQTFPSRAVIIHLNSAYETRHINFLMNH